MMLLVDTSIWIDHFRQGDAALGQALVEGTVLSHPFVIGELALGNIRQRGLILEALSACPARSSPNRLKSFTLSRSNSSTVAGSGMWTLTSSHPCG